MTGTDRPTAELDASAIAQPVRHTRIFQEYDALAVGEYFVLTNGHDPIPLRGEFEAAYPGGYAWDYVQQGPPQWRIHIRKLAGTPLPRVLADSASVVAAAHAPDAAGAVWNLTPPGRDLDSNVIRLQPGTAIAEHAGPEVDVLLLVLDGDGRITAEVGGFDLTAGQLVWLPRRSRRAIDAGPGGLTYLTVHQKRQALALDPTARP